LINLKASRGSINHSLDSALQLAEFDGCWNLVGVVAEELLLESGSNILSKTS
jgi:hypothetical protein